MLCSARRWRLAARTIALVLTMTVAIAACSSEEDASLVGLVRSPALHVGSVVLPEVDAHGAASEFSMRAAPGDLLVVFFGYTSCPDVCPTTLSDLGSALDRLGDDAARVDVAFVTVDPARDDPEVLVGYLEHFLERFHALRTSDIEEFEAAETAFLSTSQVAELPDGTIEVIHTGTTYVVDDQGGVLVEWAFGTSSSAYSNDLRALLDDRAPNDLAAVTDAWARPTAPTAPSGAVYLRITSPVDVAITGALIDPSIAASAAVHETTMAHGDDGGMAMHSVERLDLAAGEPVVFEPGGRHVMLTGLVEPLVAGETFELTFVLEGGDEILIPVEVRDG